MMKQIKGCEMNAAELITKITEYCNGKDPSKVHVAVEVSTFYADNDFDSDLEDDVTVTMITSANGTSTIIIKY